MYTSKHERNWKTIRDGDKKRRVIKGFPVKNKCDWLMCSRRVSCISIIASNHWKKMPYLKFCFLQIKRCFFFFIKLYHYKQFSGTFKICILKHSLKSFFILVETKIVLTKIFFGAHLADSVCASFFCHEWKYQLHY